MSSTPSPRAHLTLAWIVTLVISLLPNILWFELVNQDTRWLFWAKLGLLAVFFVLSLFLEIFKPLRKFFIILFLIYAFEEAVSHVADLSLWQRWFGSGDAPFAVDMFGVQLRRLLVTLLLMAAMFLLGYSRRDLFLVRGDLKAPMTPERWLGFPKADPWSRFGGQFAVYISLGTLLFLVLGGRPTLAQLGGVLPLLPAVLLFAAMNAFSEEFAYRSTLLASLQNAAGPRQAVLMAAAFFGLGHYFGVPYGILGVLMASFLGWLLGKAMVETRGFFWAWFIHFLQDVMIFSFMAIGSITPGG